MSWQQKTPTRPPRSPRFSGPRARRLRPLPPPLPAPAARRHARQHRFQTWLASWIRSWIPVASALTALLFAVAGALFAWNTISEHIDIRQGATSAAPPVVPVTPYSLERTISAYERDLERGKRRATR